MTKHAIDRAKQRYGIELSEDEVARMAALCRDGGAYFLEMRPPSGEVYRVPSRNGTLCVVYVRKSDKIVTVLPTAGHLLNEVIHSELHDMGYARMRRNTQKKRIKSLRRKK
jgi:hypothetical protein